MGKLSWRAYGTLDAFDPDTNQGVYLFIYKGQPHRIVYVGTADNFSVRWSGHQRLFRRGGRTTWRLMAREDVYALMSYEGDMAIYYKELALQLRLWAPPKAHGFEFNCLNPTDRFDLNWRAYIEHHYLPNLAIWACSLESMVEARVLETQIQRAIGAHFNIGYYDGSTSQNFLGKQQPGQDPASMRFEFADCPRGIDPETEEILRNLQRYLGESQSRQS